MRGQDYIFHIPQRTAFGQGLLRKHVQHCAAAALQPCGQGGFICQRAAGDIDEDNAIMQAAKDFLAHDAARLRRQGDAAHQNITGRRSVRQLIQRQEFVKIQQHPHGAIHAGNAAAKGFQPLCNLASHIAAAEDAHALAGKLQQAAMLLPFVLRLIRRKKAALLI